MKPQDLLEFVETILIYKFPSMTRKEVLDMLGYNYDELKNTQYYKDVLQEGQILFFKNLLEKRFGTLPLKIEKQLEQATETQLEQWSEAIFSAKHLADVFEPTQRH